MYFLFFNGYGLVMRSTYEAADSDPRLTTEARTAISTIGALQDYYKLHSKYPASVNDTDLHPTTTISNVGQIVDGWIYWTSSDGTGFEMWRKLGWDPSLVYRCTGTKGQWIFNPGDGSPEKPIALDPWNGTTATADSK